MSMYTYPPIDLLTVGVRQNSINPNSASDVAEYIIDILAEYKVNVSLSNIIPGPSLTRYEVVLERGVKISKIKSLAGELQIALNAYSVTIEPILEKGVVAIDVLKKHPDVIRLRDVIDTNAFKNSKSKTTICLGKSLSDESIVADLSQMPHLLVSGTTGSGKSSFLHSAILSLLYKASPDELRLLLIDTKRVELTLYRGIPHLLIPVITNPTKASAALGWAVGEMHERYGKINEEGARDLNSYNDIVSANGEDYKRMPRIVIIIDDFADLMMNAEIGVEDSVCRIAQMGRACGIHMIIATQKPSSSILTGTIKANIPARISFALPGIWDSRSILDAGGAENLVGKGDMLFRPAGGATLQHLQGCFTSGEDIRYVTNYLLEQKRMAEDISTKQNEEDTESYQYNSEDILKSIERSSYYGSRYRDEQNSDEDDLLADAIECVVRAEEATVPMLQRRFRIGYNRAARLIDMMEKRGIVGPADGSSPRKVLISVEQYEKISSEADDYLIQSEEYENQCSDTGDSLNQVDENEEELSLFEQAIYSAVSLGYTSVNTLIKTLNIDRTTAKDLFAKMIDKGFLGPPLLLGYRKPTLSMKDYEQIINSLK